MHLEYFVLLNRFSLTTFTSKLAAIAVMLKLVLLLLTIISSVFGQICNFNTVLRVGTQGQVFSPLYPLYTRIDCKWTITVPVGYSVHLECDDIDIPFSENCVTAALIINGYAFCSRGSATLTSKSNVMEIQLRTTGVNGRFFCRTSVKVQPCNCGRRRKMVSVTIFSNVFHSTNLVFPFFQQRIVGGNETLVNEFPYQAYLKYYGQFFCGATISRFPVFS